MVCYLDLLWDSYPIALLFPRLLALFLVRRLGLLWFFNADGVMSERPAGAADMLATTGPDASTPREAAVVAVWSCILLEQLVNVWYVLLFCWRNVELRLQKPTNFPAVRDSVIVVSVQRLNGDGKETVVVLTRNFDCLACEYFDALSWPMSSIRFLDIVVVATVDHAFECTYYVLIRWLVGGW